MGNNKSTVKPTPPQLAALQELRYGATLRVVTDLVRDTRVASIVSRRGGEQRVHASTARALIARGWVSTPRELGYGSYGPVLVDDRGYTLTRTGRQVLDASKGNR